MKTSGLLALTCMLGSASALSAPTAASLRPSVGAFRPRASAHGLALKGGGGCDLPVEIDANIINKATGCAWTVFGLLLLKEELRLPIPLMDMTGKKHATPASLFFGDVAPETASQKKMNAWTGFGFGAFGALLYVVGDTGSGAMNKDVCKANVAIQAASVYLSWFSPSKTRLEAGGGVASIVFLLANVLAVC